MSSCICGPCRVKWEKKKKKKKKTQKQKTNKKSEFNPFHLGHAYLLSRLRQRGADAIVCAMSGNFVQRGEPALVNKLSRGEMAGSCGADLVLERPTAWAMTTAETFARGGVQLLKMAGCTHIGFGSECGDLEALQRVEACLSGESFQETLRRRLEGGETFARCRQAAVEELLDPRDAALLSQPNNILAIEYLKALRRADFPMEPITFPRRGGPLDGGAADGIASASHIRRLLRAGHTEEAMAFLPRESAEVLRREIAAGRGPVDMHTCQRAILARLRQMTEEEFAAYDGGGEGLYHRVYDAVRRCATVEELLAADDAEAYDAYCAELARQVEQANTAYEALTDEQKAQLNIDKLTALFVYLPAKEGTFTLTAPATESGNAVTTTGETAPLPYTEV